MCKFCTEKYDRDELTKLLKEAIYYNEKKQRKKCNGFS